MDKTLRLLIAFMNQRIFHPHEFRLPIAPLIRRVTTESAQLPLDIGIILPQIPSLRFHPDRETFRVQFFQIPHQRRQHRHIARRLEISKNQFLSSFQVFSFPLHVRSK